MSCHASGRSCGAGSVGDYEILSIILKVLTIVVTLLIAYIDNTKK